MSNLLERLGKLTQKQLMLLAFDQQRQLEAASQRRPDAIGVIGIGCRFPGGADGPQAFWELLHEGRDAIREVPGDRWDIDSVFDPDPDAPARMSVRRGGFLDDVGGFDAAFFGISPREALTMDPQQRLLLEVAWEALEHADVAADRLDGLRDRRIRRLVQQRSLSASVRRGNEAIDAYLGIGQRAQRGRRPHRLFPWVAGSRADGRHGLLILAGRGPSGLPKPAQRRDAAWRWPAAST